MNRFLTTVCASALLAPMASSELVTLNPIADGGIDRIYAGSSKGDNKALSVMYQAFNNRGDQIAYFKFDLSGIDVTQVLDATAIWDYDGGGFYDADVSVGVWAYNDGGANEDFDASALNWSVAEAAGDVNASADIFNSTYLGAIDNAGDTDGNDWIFNDPDESLVNQIQADSNGILTLMLRSNTGGPYVGFASSETTAYEQPRLILDVVPEPASLMLMGLGGLALLRRSPQA